MRGLVSILVLMLIVNMSQAQNNEEATKSRPLNSLNVNLLGNASLIGLNYDRLFILHPNIMLSFKAGMGYTRNVCFPTCNYIPTKLLTLPHHLSLNFGTREHFLEIGVGGTLMVGPTREHYVFYPLAGYRVSPMRSARPNVRVFVHIPHDGLYARDFWFIPFGVSFGISF